ncbi:monovalent cation/H+ antiporter subunit D [Pseudoalteromonas sp. CO325X]|uniref:monovalent cation/H+ antiporter subunit D n=1 Tax=Pseudoalteromonas sp. CO325X TaxID=1777262 RepID=UPI0010239F63|nr:monovalent cation/H+ antiporter subunit D [Pseudoalteromonas sp. CO325X]RZF80577.1 monovalent cation/H+ antiporter subunit D [Pseudoalteromonas sp. CO325X]
MMQHLITLPILLPLLAGIILLLPPCGKNLIIRRWTAMFMALLALIASTVLLQQLLQGGPIVYAIGTWQPPFGIVLYADPLAVLLTILTSFLTLVTTIYASRGDDKKGSFYHPLTHFLLMGVNGAFLTGDLFNLFVFFEVLLIASYALLMHKTDKQTTKAALHYVVLNLVGSSIFLIALGILYGVLGTLNMADLATKVAQLQGDDIYLAKIGGLLLLIVFALKAALLPLHLWLAATYSRAMPAVAAQFAVMTKVGIYAMMRVFTMIFGDNAGELSGMATTWLWPLALVTLVVGAVGVLASEDLRRLTANLVIVSVGTLVAMVALNNEQATAVAIYYLLHSTVGCAAMFLVADLIGLQRGKVQDRLVNSRSVAEPKLLGICFVLCAIALAGLPPLSGFIAKLWLLDAAWESNVAWVFWPIYLIVSLATLVALSRAGTSLFWHDNPQQDEQFEDAVYAGKRRSFAVLLMLAVPVLMTVFAAPLTEVSQHAAATLHNTQVAVDTVFALAKGQ